MLRTGKMYAEYEHGKRYVLEVVTCDICYEIAFDALNENLPELSSTTFIENLRAVGWRLIGGVWFCPQHVLYITKEKLKEE